MHFLACAIGVNVMGTHAWYVLQLCKPPFAILSCFCTIFLVVLNICFPCLSFFTHASTQEQIRRRRTTAAFETMMVETDDPRPASKSFSTIYFRWQSKKLTNMVECYKITACIRSQHTTGASCGPDQESVVENRHTTGLKVVAPGLLEKIQLCEVRNNNVLLWGTAPGKF